mgnify:CR=1 FL=1
MLPIVLPAPTVDALFQATTATPGYTLTIDLERQQIDTPDQGAISFEIDPFRKDCLLHGLDDIALTLKHETKIAQYEQATEIA